MQRGSSCAYLGSKIEIGEVIWDMKFQGPKCAHFGTIFREGEIIRGLTFPCSLTIIFSLKIFGGMRAAYLGSLKSLVWLFGGLRKLIDMSTLILKVIELTTEPQEGELLQLLPIHTQYLRQHCCFNFS